ncbi:MAG: type II toxin-antitoxin system HigB family toxin [Cytophagales bacterium]|nr:type II toxin-antitoxin system HigB family toxin [Cytophagales bacterium]
MNVIAKSRIVAYQQQYGPAAKTLQSWLTIASKAKWLTPNDVKQSDPRASIINDERVVFDMGDNYRLVVAIDYRKQWLWIKFFGTHAEYDRIDAKTI